MQNVNPTSVNFKVHTAKKNYLRPNEKAPKRKVSITHNLMIEIIETYLLVK